MKTYRTILLLGLLLAASPAFAAPIQLDVDIPTLTPGPAMHGKGQAVYLRVTDARPSHIIGKTLDGQEITNGQDLDAAIDNSLSDVLHGAGFLPQMIEAGAGMRMQVSIDSLGYSIDSHFLTSKAHLDCKLSVHLIQPGKGTLERSFDAHGDYTLFWHPTEVKLSKLVNDTLHDALQAMLQDRGLAVWLNAAPM
jgi:uncharacterized lipoprotein YajG